MARYLTTPGKVCYHCGSDRTYKAGFSKFAGQQKQRYKCAACSRHFRDDPAYTDKTPREHRPKITKNMPSASHLILELQALAQMLKRTPKAADIVEMARKKRCRSLKTYRAVFGEFREAVKRAKLDPTYGRSVNPEVLLAELRTLNKKLGKRIAVKDIERAAANGKGHSRYFFERAFGSLTGALIEAGLKPLHLSNEELLECLRRIQKTVDGPVEHRHILEFHKRGEAPYPGLYTKKFGSIAEARRLAKIKRGADRQTTRKRSRKVSQENLDT